LIPAGTGLAYHKERKRKRDIREADKLKAAGGMSASADEVEARLTEAFSDK
jgi:DNA-directed RNA polymerase subunit beta'